MVLFQTVRKNLTVVKFDPNQTDSYTSLIRQHWNCFFQSSLSIISLVLYLLHDANSIKEYMDSMFLTTAAFTIFVSFTSIVFKTPELYMLFDNIKEAANKRIEISPKSKAILVKANSQVDLMSKIIYFLMVKLTLPCLLLPLAIVSYYRYFFTDLENDAFMLTVPTWFPFDWKNPYGYALALTLQFIMYLNPLRFIACFSSLAFGSFWISNLFVRDGIEGIQSMNDLTRNDQSKMYKTLIGIICGHSDLKQLICEFSNLYEIIFTAVFAGCTLLICISMLTIQVEISHDEFDAVMLLVSIFYGLFAFLILFAPCELCERAGSFFNEFDNEIVQLDWYLFPLKIKKMLPIVIMGTQDPVLIKCFGSIACTRWQFKKVVNASYSYFTVLREFYK